MFGKELPLIRDIDAALHGYPESILAVILFGLAIVAIVVALFGNPTLKAAVSAWMILP